MSSQETSQRCTLLNVTMRATSELNKSCLNYFRMSCTRCEAVNVMFCGTTKSDEEHNIALVNVINKEK